jgi:hypothetical protein
MTAHNHVYKVTGYFLAVRTHDIIHCIKCNTKTHSSAVFGQKFKIIAENKLIQKTRCGHHDCNTVRRSFCKFKRYSVVTGYPYLGKQYKMERYITPTWVSTALDSIEVSYEEMRHQRMEHRMAKPKLRRIRLPRKYPHNHPPQPDPNIHNRVGDDYVRAIRAYEDQRQQGQPSYPQVSERPYIPSEAANPFHNRDYYNYRNNLVEPSEEGE